MKVFKKLFAFVCAGAAVFLCACSASPFLDKALADGKVGTEYNDSIANGDKNMYYDLDYDSPELPSGLMLYDDGTVSGIPAVAGDFTFTAVMIDLKDVETLATFTLHIDKGELAYAPVELKPGKTEEPYLADVASATGAEKIEYAVKEGREPPAGLTVSAEGVLSGIPAETAENASFVVVASAAGCDSVEAEFTITIEEGEHKDDTLGEIFFTETAFPDGTVGEAYSQSLRLAYGVPDIQYSYKYATGYGAPKGLSIDRTLGLIAGTPADSTDADKEVRVQVTASAAGYETKKQVYTFKVFDKYQAATRFETEYVDTINKLSGAGYSSAPKGTGMIQKCPKMSNGLSLGYLNKPVDVAFKITAQSDTTARLVLGLGSEVGDFVYDPSMFSITVNGKEINYGALSVKQIGSGVSDFASSACPVSPVIELTAGENVIVFNIKETDKATGTFSAVGCLFDYVELTDAGCELGWYPRLGNIV